MADCSKHDVVVEEQAKIKERISAIEAEVSNGWIMIRENKNRVDSLERASERVEEKTQSIFRMLKELTQTIKSIDDKLDILATDTRKENAEINRRIAHLETKTSINANNFEWSWKNILAIGTVATFLLSMISQIFIGKI